ncbi:8-oxo-dGTP pyrophosphatase MutT (NUDIX family) [Phytomonospora endophytica]|uniref:8-oxo-dGTP pyrophosphatase MutT (NUDIX family) n=1 Tax=Phytomonospora endophytica TaxID=714109 RepID=A0A841FET9_9ACTN|nr:NUDIX domain-containing protein [Phytomonospora endophytica]MBB6033513.1 8-oxo-dGTP pyrophosphatase MutT (NUDIX family) [Phytomonospora endophytica]GIG64970.1 NUDIX hydrolase [Phytomonospora endophytica]
MLFDDVRDRLSRWTPHAEAREAYEATVVLLDDGPAVLAKANPGAHVTASALVVSHDLSEVLLCLHGKARKWMQLGGHIEPGDATLLAAALREVAEESGLAGVQADPVPIDVDRHRARCGGGEAWHHDVRFAFRAAPGATPRVSDESLDLAWVPAGDLPEPLAAATARLVPLAVGRFSG